MRIENGVPVAPDIPAMTAEGRSLAASRSASCRHCGGQGLAIVDVQDVEARSSTAAATCVCLHGRWIRAWHQGHNAERILDRIPDLAGIMAGRDRRYRFDQSEYDSSATALTRDQINSMFKRSS